MAWLIIFHILTLPKVVPSDMIWGGQITDTSTNLATLETISLLVTLVFAIIIAAKMGYIQVARFKKAIDIVVWVIFAYLILNTVGNLASGVAAENLFFALVTLVLAIFAPDWQ